MTTNNVWPNWQGKELYVPANANPEQLRALVKYLSGKVHQLRTENESLRRQRDEHSESYNLRNLLAEHADPERERIK